MRGTVGSVFKSHPPPPDIENDGWISPGFGWSTIQNASLLVELDAECVHTPEPILKMEIGISAQP